MSGSTGWSAAQLQTLREAIARGVLEVEGPDGRRVRYADLDQMMQAATTIENDLIARGLLARQGAPAVQYVAFSRG
jgi:hypothetical protein